MQTLAMQRSIQAAVQAHRRHAGIDARRLRWQQLRSLLPRASRIYWAIAYHHRIPRSTSVPAKSAGFNDFHGGGVSMDFTPSPASISLLHQDLTPFRGVVLMHVQLQPRAPLRGCRRARVVCGPPGGRVRRDWKGRGGEHKVCS